MYGYKARFDNSLPVVCVAGRVDAQNPDPENRLPAETSTASELLAAYQGKGLSVQEFVVLVGAHTVSICVQQVGEHLCAMSGLTHAVQV